MNSNIRDSLTASALELSGMQKPNSDTHEELFLKCVHIGNRAHAILMQPTDNSLAVLESLLVEIGQIRYDIHEFDKVE